MSPGASLEGLQWILYEQNTNDLLIQKNGERLQLAHKYYRGEKEIGGYTCDGYALINNVHHFWEYLGCFFHKNCPNIGCPFYLTGKDIRWEQKEKFLKSKGVLHSMRGCTWKLKLKKIKGFPTPSMPLVTNY